MHIPVAPVDWIARKEKNTVRTNASNVSGIGILYCTDMTKHMRQTTEMSPVTHIQLGTQSEAGAGSCIRSASAFLSAECPPRCWYR